MADTYTGEDANAKAGIDVAAEAEERLTASTSNTTVEKKTQLHRVGKTPTSKRGSGNNCRTTGKVMTIAAMMGTCHR